MKNNDKEKSNSMFNITTTILEIDKSTGESPTDLFVVDEHTDHYLTVQPEGTFDLGESTGIIAGIGGCVFIAHGLVEAKVGSFDSAYIFITAGILSFLLPFLCETLRPSLSQFYSTVAPVKCISSTMANFSTPHGMELLP